MVDIICLSDLHGHFPKDLPGGDLLIVAGDLTARDESIEWCKFFDWLESQKYTKKIFIGGNHDNYLIGINPTIDPIELGLPKSYRKDFEYLCDSGTEFEGLKIWGSPWSLTFPGMNPKCKAFTVDTEEELAEKWALIPDDIDILITHSPPYGILDSVVKDLVNGKKCIPGYVHCGSKSLSDKMEKNPRPRLHIFGHIHEWGGKQKQYGSNTIMINASHVNERYQPVNKPIRVVL